MNIMKTHTNATFLRCLPTTLCATTVLACSLMSLPALAGNNPNFPAQKQFEGQALLLNGLGLRKKVFFKLYWVGLYVQTKTQDAKAVLNGENKTTLRMQITSPEISQADMKQSIADGFKQSSKNFAAMQPRIKQFFTVFDQPIKQGDVFDFSYTNKSTHIIKNGKVVTKVAGSDFKTDLLGIWLGDKPVHPGLKKKLLSGR